MLGVDKQYHCRNVFSRWVDLAYNKSKQYNFIHHLTIKLYDLKENKTSTTGMRSPLNF